jgi:hypothetical protein
LPLLALPPIEPLAIRHTAYAIAVVTTKPVDVRSPPLLLFTAQLPADTTKYVTPIQMSPNPILPSIPRRRRPSHCCKCVHTSLSLALVIASAYGQITFPLPLALAVPPRADCLELLIPILRDATDAHNPILGSRFSVVDRWSRISLMMMAKPVCAVCIDSVGMNHDALSTVQ